MKLFIFWIQAVCIILLTNSYAKASVEITDDMGKKIILQTPAKRIISLYGAISEIINDFGIKDTIVGCTVSDTIMGMDTPKVGTHLRPNIEAIVALQPDLIIQFANKARSERILQTKIPVATFYVNSFFSLFTATKRIGILCGVEKIAITKVNDMQARLNALKNNDTSSFPTIFYEVRYPNLLGAGSSNMVTDIITAAGGKNILSDYPDKLIRLSEEKLLALNPDIYIYQIGPMNKQPLPPEQRNHFAMLKAVTNNHVFSVDELIFSRPGPQSILAAEKLASIIKKWQNNK